MESQASLMVNCMLLAFRKLRLYDDVDNSNYTTFTNITSTLNFTMLDSQQRADNDSLEANALDSQSYHRNIYQWVAKITLFVGPASFIMYHNVLLCVDVCIHSIPFRLNVYFPLLGYSRVCGCASMFPLFRLVLLSFFLSFSVLLLLMLKSN